MAAARGAAASGHLAGSFAARRRASCGNATRASHRATWREEGHQRMLAHPYHRRIGRHGYKSAVAASAACVARRARRKRGNRRLGIFTCGVVASVALSPVIIEKAVDGGA